MILYTMMPHELIFPQEEKESTKQMAIRYEGIPLLVELTNGGECQVIRNLSTDPNHYLDPRCTPGTKISFI